MRLFTPILLTAAAAGAFFLAGCGDEPRPPATNAPASATNEGPDWLNDPTMNGKYLYAAYGTAEKMIAGEQLQRQNAMTDARKQIAAIISVKIQSVFKNWTREGGEITTQDNRQMAMTMVEDVSRAVTNQTLEGSVQRARWISPTGKLYVWVYIDPAQIEAMKKATAAAAREQMEKRAHFAAKIEADKAFADLDKLIDKEMSGQ
jgi:hypothetical protein